MEYWVECFCIGQAKERILLTIESSYFEEEKHVFGTVFCFLISVMFEIKQMCLNNANKNKGMYSLNSFILGHLRICLYVL